MSLDPSRDLSPANSSEPAGPWCSPAVAASLAGLRPYAIRKLILTKKIGTAMIHGHVYVDFGELERHLNAKVEP